MSENLPSSDLPPPAQPPPSPAFTSRNWCTLIHASPLIIFLTGFGHILAPLIIWLVKREESPEIDAAGRNVLNFQISYTIYFLVAWVLVFVFIGFLLLPILAIAWLVFVIMGTIKSTKGENYIYPLCIRFL